MNSRANIIGVASGYIGKTPFNFDQWCGSFALKVLHDCGFGLHIPIIDGGSGARLCQSLSITKSPLPGDIVRMQVHFGIFVGMTFDIPKPGKTVKDWKVITIDGGTFLDRVYMTCRDMHPKTEFFSIERLINGN